MDGYRRLAAWQRCRELCVAIYEASNRFPRAELFGFVAQLRPAGISACANLAEGYARRGLPELRRFIRISLGSLAEVDALVVIAHDLGYLGDVAYEDLRGKYLEASKATFGLLKAARRPSIPTIPTIPTIPPPDPSTRDASPQRTPGTPPIGRSRPDGRSGPR